jgi:hypothetical protein
VWCSCTRGDGRTSGNHPLLARPRKLGAVVLLAAILGPLFLQCGQGGRKGPDGHGSELGNRNRGLLHPALGQMRFQAKHMPECRSVGRNSAIGFSDVALLFQES